MNELTFVQSPDGPALPMVPPSNKPAVVQSETAQIAQQRDRDRLIWAAQRPRNHEVILERVLVACKRASFAQIAVWEKPISGKMTKGPGIRLAELIAKHYGNLETGFRIVPEKSNDKRTTVEIFCWDLETNYSHCPEIVIEHKFGGKNKGYETDVDAIYRIAGSQISRKLRDAIWKVVDADIKELAYERCLKTLSEVVDLKPIIDRMLGSFAELGVKPEHLENYVGKKLVDFDQADVGQLRVVFDELQEGGMKVSDITEAPARTPVTPTVATQAAEPAAPKAAAPADQKKGKTTKAKADPAPPSEEAPVDVTAEPVAPSAPEETAPVSGEAISAAVEGIFE